MKLKLYFLLIVFVSLAISIKTMAFAEKLRGELIQANSNSYLLSLCLYETKHIDRKRIHKNSIYTDVGNGPGALGELSSLDELLTPLGNNLKTILKNKATLVSIGSGGHGVFIDIAFKAGFSEKKALSMINEAWKKSAFPEDVELGVKRATKAGGSGGCY